MIINFEGLDASGKSTQCRLLKEKLESYGKTVKYFHFPFYETESGKIIQKLLDNPNRDEAGINEAIDEHLLEFNPIVEQANRDYDYVLLDRWYYTNYAYGNYMTKHDLIEPNLMILIDIDAQVSFKRRPTGRNVAESSFDKMVSVSANYREMAQRFRWFVIDGSGSQHHIHDNVETILGVYDTGDDLSS